MGMHFTQAAPKKYQAPANWVEWAQQNCAESGGSVRLTEDPVEAVENADYIYTDLWWWVGQEDQIPERRAAFMPTYQVNLQLFEKAPSHCKFMHCLPASRGVEATDEVMDHSRSIIFAQSENRLHTEKGLLVYFVYPRLQRPSDELKAFHQAKIDTFLEKVSR
jgi:putrescine carbamoyltransferase